MTDNTDKIDYTKYTGFTPDQLKQAMQNYQRIGKYGRQKKEAEETPERKAHVQAKYKELRAKLNYTPKPKPKPLYTPKPFNLMDFQEAINSLWFDFLKRNCKGYVVDDSNKGLIEQLVRYIIRDDKCRFDLDKGICLLGDLGTGKTYLMEQLSKFSQHHKLVTAFKYVTEEEIRIDMKATKGESFTKYTCNQWCFDDLGTKPNLKIYGDDYHLLNDLIHSRYKKWDKNRIITHVTANFTTEELNVDTTNFDARAISRLNQMCNVYYLTGESKRKL